MTVIGVNRQSSPTQESLLKSKRERMDIISAAYRQVVTYRGAAELCGTTHKTAKRVVQRDEAGGVRPGTRRAWPQLRRGRRAGG